MSRPTSTPSAERPPLGPRWLGSRWLGLRWPGLRSVAAIWALAWAVGGLCAGVGGLAVMQLGLYDVAATKQHNPQVGWVLHNTMIHSVQLRAHGIKPPPPADATEIAA